jgi:AAA family ATPase
LLSPSLLLTARLEEGSQVQVFPLHGKTANKHNSFLPSLRDAQEAGYIRLREISEGPTKSAQVDTPDSGKRRDWLAILLREHLGKCHIHYHVVACMLTQFSWTKIYHIFPDRGSFI